MAKEYIVPDYLTKIIADGAEIVWVGSESDEELIIRILYQEKLTIVYFKVSNLPVPKDCYVVKHNEATTKPLEFVSIIWKRKGWSRTLEVASMYGINVGCNFKPGLGNLSNISNSLCTMGYDIETSQHLVKTGGFPPPYSRITSIALWCSCGYCEAWTTIKHKPVPKLTYCKNSRTLTRLSLNAIADHMPQWLVGYNCYQFDNCSLLFHAPEDMRKLFKSVNTGTKSASRHAFYLDILGVNNVDLYSYLDKKMRGKYKALGLGAVAEFHKMAGKTQMPITDSEDTVYDLVSYNINDSKLTAQLWHITDVCDEVVNLCVTSCAPLVDCVRYISGTMASCAWSSYCISKGVLMDWSECNLRIGYEGGSVLEPVRGVFRNVTVCDFSAMYPTIIRDVGISPENIEVLSTCSKQHEDKILWWNERCTMACIKGKIVKFLTEGQCMAREVLEVTTNLRNKYKKTNKHKSDSLKGVNNSLYGAYGFASSPLHSPRCAASVTVSGRTVHALGSVVFRGFGLNVLYGDTDSFMIGEGKLTKHYKDGGLARHIKDSVDCFHKILQFTPFPNMKLEIEEEYQSILLIDKKHYAYKDSTGNVKTKGLSETRKDRLGLCRDITSLIAEQVLSNASQEENARIISAVVNACYNSAISHTLDMYSVSKEVRYEGTTCYRYKNTEGEDTSVPVTRADNAVMIDYDAEKVLQFFEKDVNKLCIPAGIGTVKTMLENVDL